MRICKYGVVGILFMVCIANAFTVDHTCTDITKIPQSAIEQATTSLHIAYGHTSHGSQLVDGMRGLIPFANGGGLGLSLPNNLFWFSEDGWDGGLKFNDYAFDAYGAHDLGNPDRIAWASATRSYLADHPAVNVIIWSWCGQVDGTAAEINTYLSLMNQLELDYPNVKFVYMTGYLNGTGQTGNVNVRNQQIRDYCAAHNKILYDFADIESYDPDGLVNYMVLNADDAANYDGGNWAVAWQNSHTVDVDWYDCGCAHCESAPLIANRKAYAAWWLWARLGGWSGACPVPHTADFNHDCKVNLDDFLMLAKVWQSSSTAIDIAPAVPDGIVNMLDLQELALQWMAGL